MRGKQADGQEKGRGQLRGKGPARGVGCLLVSLLLAGYALICPEGKRARAEGGRLVGWSFMVDPGHGGSDSGAVGPTGLKEKDVNLSVALRLRDLLVREGAVVHMTREDDSYVSITDRWQAANALGVDRFLSVHHNAYSDPNTNYVVTLISTYAGEVTEDLARRATNEISWELGVPAHSNPVWRVDYVGVLNHTEMPAILTEGSFISNPAEEARLRDPTYNQREAEAIFRAVLYHCEPRPAASFIEPREGSLLDGDSTAKLSVSNPSLVSQVDFFLEGGLIGSSTSAPYQLPLPTGSLDDGVYELRADVRFTSGQVLSVSTHLAVSRAARRWYFAEGTTREGFDEWLTLLNPNPGAVSVAVTYCFDTGSPQVRTYELPGMSRLSVDVRAAVGSGRDVSLQVDSPSPVVAERPMYFNYRAKWQGGHVSLGANRTSSDWYFAEGYTGTGFEEWLCVYNPGEGDVDVEAEYQMEEGAPFTYRWTVPGRSRYSQLVNQVVGPGHNVSVRLRASGEVVAERPMYFDYSGKWQGGHASLGVNRPSGSWYFAEGFTGTGFEEWLCLQNPGDEPATVHVSYVTADGVQAREPLLLSPRSRRTIFVNSEVGPGREVSMTVHSDGAPVVAERPIYYDYQGRMRGGDIGNGVSGPSSAWFFSEGYTGTGFEEWLCLLNPQPEEVRAVLVLYLPEDEVIRQEIDLPALTRRTLYINQLSYLQGDTSMCVQADLPVVAERPQYFKYGGKWSGGSLQSGFFPGMR